MILSQPQAPNLIHRDANGSTRTMFYGCFISLKFVWPLGGKGEWFLPNKSIEKSRDEERDFPHTQGSRALLISSELKQPLSSNCLLVDSSNKFKCEQKWCGLFFPSSLESLINPFLMKL